MGHCILGPLLAHFEGGAATSLLSVSTVKSAISKSRPEIKMIKMMIEGSCYDWSESASPKHSDSQL